MGTIHSIEDKRKVNDAYTIKFLFPDSTFPPGFLVEFDKHVAAEFAKRSNKRKLEGK